MAIENRFASESYVSEALEPYLQADDLNDYAKLNDLNDYAKLDALNDYSKLSDLNDYAKLDTLNAYATTEYVDSEVERVLSLTERVKSWGAVQYYVRNGQAPYIFNIGDQLVCNSEQFGELVWDIIGFDQDIPSDSQYTHSMTLQLHNVLDTTTRVYDSKQFVYCAESDLAPGTYYLYYNPKIDKTGNDSYLQLIIEDGVTVPSGAKLYGASTTSMQFVSDDLSETYWTGKLTSKGATVPTDGLILGECDYWNISNGGNYYYKNADIRTFLNGENMILDWNPIDNLQIPPDYINNPGFLYQIDPEFREVLGVVKKKIYNLETCEIEEVEDLVFLPSSSELFGTHIIDKNENEINLGEPYDYYKINSDYTEPNKSADSNRIKYDSTNTARMYYLRSPHAINTGTANNSAVLSRIQTVNTVGTIASGPCHVTTSYLTPCCCII